MPSKNRAILPEDIDLSTDLSNTFGKREVETAAVELIKFLVYRDKGWADFKLSDLVIYYYTLHMEKIDRMLFGLLGYWYDDGPGEIRQDQGWLYRSDDLIVITKDFIERVSSHKRKK